MLNGVFALAVVLVACAIGTVAWKCVDSLQKHTDQLHSYQGQAVDIKVDSRAPDFKKEMDSRVLSDQMDPNMAIRAPITTGSEIPFEKGTIAMTKVQFAEAAADFTQALAMIPVEASTKHLWNISGSLVGKKVILATVYEKRACCYMEIGRYALAKADLTASIKLRPDYILNYRNRAKVYGLLGEKSLEAADLKTIQTMTPH